MAYIIIISCMGIQLLLVKRLPPPPPLVADRLRPAYIEYTHEAINPKSIKAAAAPAAGWLLLRNGFSVE